MAAIDGGRTPLRVLNPEPGTSGGRKERAIEEIYQKKSQLEHILIRPDTYIGSVEKESSQMWVYDAEKGMVLRDVSFVPGLYKIFDEILVNAADNKIRDPKMTTIRVEIDSIYNNGRGIPVTIHKGEKMYVPTMIFGHLLTSSNYDDDQKKVVGGRNGYGAKLCNIFSTMFKLETSSKEYKKSFSQVWRKNMMEAEEPKISEAKGEDFTRVTFQPDLRKFKMDKLDKDIVDLFSRRAYDVAGTSKGVKVYLNGERLSVTGFRSYVDLFLKSVQNEDTEEPLKLAHEVVNDRWEIAVTMSDKGFQQVSFVNSIATTRGGKHVDYIAEQVIAKLTETVKKKAGKKTTNVRAHQLRNHLWVFVNCLIENPTFDSQTKETMTLQSKNFGSKCAPSEKFFNAVMKTGVVESVLTWIQYKQQVEMDKKCSSRKVNKLKGIAKLEDANDAGTKNSLDCTLILTEGDSAKSLVIAGFGVVGRDKFGVFPLRGKMLNVREATHKQIMENSEINNLVKILGLQYKKKYTTIEDLKSLRYGKLMIMTDQDQDGSHIKGLLINFIHYNWPSLMKMNFLEEFITPIVKVSKGHFKKSFYSLPEFEEWKQQTPNYKSFKIKYYKGLGTSTSEEAKEYFSDMRRHRIKFTYEGEGDDRAVELAFSKKCVDARKEWLTQGMEERRRRREAGEKEIYLYESTTTHVSYKDFINKELILFSNMDNERSIPSLVDGLKPGQRKVIFTCFKRNDKREVKVAQLAGAVGELSAYHHGEMSLMATIIGLAQNYVGSNNINLLQPLGQFGTRLAGGKDAASPRYIFTMLSPLARKLFPPVDDPLLTYLYDDNLRIEPEYYVPIIPMVLVNGAEGIGTGWRTSVPNYNPREIAANIKRVIRGEEMQPMHPWYKGFVGSIVRIDATKYVVNGEVGVLDNKSIEITELPVRTWTSVYKETVLDPMLHGTDKIPASITDYREYHTDTTVKFVVHMAENRLSELINAGIHRELKLQSATNLTTMVLFDSRGVLRRYNSANEIVQEFYPLRLEFYKKRKRYYEGMLEAEALKLANQARFILEKNDKKIVMENIKRKDFMRVLIERNYDSDPVKAWKVKHQIDEEREENNEEEEETIDLEQEEGKEKKYDFDYLIDMTMRNMLRENIDELLKKRDAKREELEELRRSTPEMLWERDLDAFLQELDRVEAKEREEASQAVKPKRGGAGGKGKGVKAQRIQKISNEDDFKPSPDAERLEPKIDLNKYLKEAKEPGAKKRGGKKKDTAANEFDGEETDITVPDSDENEDEGTEKPKKKAPKKKLAKVNNEESDSNLPNEEKATKMKPSAKSKNPKPSKSGKAPTEKRKATPASDESSTPMKKKVKRGVITLSSSEEDPDSDVEIQVAPTPLASRMLREKKQTNYKAFANLSESESDESEDQMDQEEDDFDPYQLE